MVLKPIDSSFRFEPGDHILMSDKGQRFGLYMRLKRWLLGSRWDHIAIFFAYTKRGLPLKVESDGKESVVIRSLLVDEGRWVRILRFKDKLKARVTAEKAEKLADNPTCWYDFLDIARFVLPRLIWYKIFGCRFSFGYKHNPSFICSEFANEADGRIIPEDREPPLPDDFNYLKEFFIRGEGYLKLRK